MTINPTTALLLCLSLAFALASAQASAAEFTHCEVKGSMGNSRVFAECATLPTPEDFQDPTGHTIDLTIARIDTPAAQPAADALLVINGGPGGSSIELLADYWPVFSSLGKERDVLAMDQRGTGLSNRLECETVTESFDANPNLVEAAVEECLSALDADPRHYTTSVAVRDIEAMRAALGYEQLTIYGVSYGTRVAQHYLRRYPERVRAVILDGVVPADEVLGAAAVHHSQEALDQLFTRCETDPSCNPDDRDLTHMLRDIRSSFEANGPVTVAFRHPVTNQPTEQEITYEHLAAAIRFMLYAPETAALIPLTVQAVAEQQDYTPIASQAVLVLERLADSIASGMQAAVACTEDVAFFGAAEANIQALDATYLTAALVEGMQAMCASWPKGLLDEDLRTPITSDKPVLVLSGEVDPITPVAWGEQIMPGLSNARHLIAPGQGHGVIGRGCVPKLAGEFIDTLNAEALDAQCLEGLTPFPFFSDPLGPQP